MNTGADSQLFEDVIRELLRQGLSARFQARGGSMSPTIRDGDIVEVTPVIVRKLRKDDIVLAKSNYGFRLHRLVSADFYNDVFITRGDSSLENDPALKALQILGVAYTKEVRVGRHIVQARFQGVRGWTLRAAARAQYLATKVRRSAMPSNSPRILERIKLAIFFLLLFAAVALRAQVAVDTTTTGSAELTGAGARTLTISHTTAGANRLMIVGVSINITNSNATVVSGVTSGGTALTLIGAHNDAGNTRRVEQWYLLAPPTGTANVIVTVNIPTGVTEGVAAGVTTFTGVDQTVPLGSFVSADGAAGAASQMDVPSVVNGMILDTLAIGGNRTATIPGPQVQQWNLNTGGGGATDVTATGSSRTGAPSVPISETIAGGGTSNWSLGATPINPSTADIAVTTSVSAVALGQNSTYTITIANNGPSAANGVTLADTYNATNLSLVSYTPSAGTSCTNTATTINCTLPTPFASGATATVSVVVSTTAAGFYPNSATITDSGTPPDPNTGNNTYVALAPVVSVVCSTTTLTSAPSPLSGVQNTYFPGTASVTAGATSIPIGTSTGAGGTIAAGSLLLVIQMQDASINPSNSVAYGNGSTGSGFTTINNAGNYEYVKATGPVSAGSVPITGAGAGAGLVFGYTAIAASATKGVSTYQVVLVPQYATATLGAAQALPWNGSTGGILALDVAGQLNLGGATVNLDGTGFRGGAGLQLTGGTGANTDYWATSPAAYTGAAVAGVDGAKGEGVAGTPEWVQSGATFLKTTSNYPSGTTGLDGSMAHGAPGNAGGGGTDADPAANDENAGGGGGGNGGTGGFGGDSWNTNLSTGGEGGAPFPATIDRIAMGGGGGAGSRNNSDTNNQASSGSAGGGIVFIRADSLTGTATITANGAAAYIGTVNDAGGGAGAGGTIVILSANGGEGGLTLQANGGRGGDAWDAQAYSLAQRHGPGGGGGGGVIFVSGTPASMSVAGGANGTTLNPGVAYGATSGTAGTTGSAATLSQVTGIQSAALCTPDMTLSKSHAGNFTRGTNATYTIPVTNISPYGPSNGLVTINDTLPIGITPISATGTGWTCSVSGQTVSCTRSDALAAATAYPSITLSAAVSQAAPATLTNIATVAGGGEANLLNDTATDVANVGSTADLSMSDSGSPNPVAAGANLTYTQVLTNNGPSAADNATLIAPIPANTTFVNFSAPAGWSCSLPAQGATGNVVCADVNMAGGTAASFTLVVGVNGTVTKGTVITDTVSASSSTADPISTNNTATASDTVGGTANALLSVTNIAAPNPVVAGNNITFTQVVTNTGASAATGATFTESTPANTTFVSITPPAGWTCSAFPPTCTNPSVAAGSSATFNVVYKVNGTATSGTTITDTATVNATNQSFGANSATATDIVAAATDADLALTTAATPASVYSGNNITYTQTVTNNGPATSSAVVFTEATPTNTTFESVSAPTGWTCTTPAVGATGTITCNAATLAAGSAADIIVVVNVPSTVVAGTITANSSVSATTNDPNSANNSTTVATPVTIECDLAVTNTGPLGPVTANSNITYTQVITNNGPSSCGSSTFNEATPTGTNFGSVAVVNAGGVTWTCPNTAPVACTAPTVPPGSTATITAIYHVPTGTVSGTIITDIDTVSTSHDSNPANNSATETTAVAAGTVADLRVTNSATPNPVTAGSNITYTQTVTNGGPATSTTPKLVETISANTTAVSLTGPAGWTCVFATLTCTDGTNLANGATAGPFTLIVTVNSNVASGTAITETDTISSTRTDPDPNNNSVTITTGVADAADLAITNTASPVPVQAGNNITYTQVVTNNGPSNATTASMTETTPPNTTFQSISIPAGWSCTTPAVNGTGTINCTNPSLAAGSSSFTLVLKVNAGTAAGTAFNDTATVASAVNDSNSANNSATAADVVATATQADLVVTNTPSASSVTAGSNVTYTQAVTNNGPATATTLTFTQVTPPNTTFQSITPPAGWTCGTVPPAGGTGTITCTATTMVTGTVNFSLILQVNSNTPSGTSITDTATASASNIVPGLTTNTANATILVASANSADMAITKIGSPNPVTQGTPLTYTLSVVNNGPASATNATVTDTLPSTLTYLSSTTTQGSCSEAGGTVTCLLGTMANAGTATITILTLPTSAGQISNTANVTADQTDSNLANNTSTWLETVISPTSVRLQSFSAHFGTDKNGATRALLTWKTGGEAHNLGFNVYRELNGNRVRMNPSLIAGSALLMNGALSKHSGRSYAWIDPSAPTAGTSYWLEDVDVNGTRTLHGPVEITSGSASSDASLSETRMFSQIAQAQPAQKETQDSHFVETLAQLSIPTLPQMEKQFQLAAQPAVKIGVQHEGWYRVTQPDLVKAGLDPNVDPSLLHLYAEAIEQPIQITGATPGPGGFGSQAAINFYGTAIDTEFSGTRVYWLVAGEAPGTRIRRTMPLAGSNQPPRNFTATVEMQPHAIYFAALLTSNGQNFFGPLVSPTPVDEVLSTPHVDMTSPQQARLQVVLQGIIVGYPHDVQVAVNGTTVGDVTWTGQDKGTLNVVVPTGVLQNWTNTVTLTAQNGDYDTSLIQSIRVTYPHTYEADSDELKFTGRAGDQLDITGFSTAPTVVDVTDPNRPVQVLGQVIANNGKYAMALQVPWTTTNSAATSRHTLLAVADTRISSAFDVRPNHPSHWHSPQAGADIAMVTYEEFAGALLPLARAHQGQGKSSAIVAINDLYDEFTFGEHSPFAIREFLQSAQKNWRKPPTYLLLNGRASLDPRNYLGFGHLDLVPTSILPSSSLMTASDDWFSDFTDVGMPTIATGRLPVSTTDEAKTVVGKIVAYEGNSTNGPWTSQAMVVADKDDTVSFSSDSQTIQLQIPASVQVSDVFTSTVGVTAAQQEIISGINSGQLLVNYLGHGSEEAWSGSDIFDTNSLNSLTNSSQLPVFLIMNCLNGFFQDVYAQPLGVDLILAPNGGAVAVLASTGLNQPDPQVKLDTLVLQNAFSSARPTLGESILKAKSNIGDPGVRRTYVLFGDPAMQIKQPASQTAH